MRSKLSVNYNVLPTSCELVVAIEFISSFAHIIWQSCIDHKFCEREKERKQTKARPLIQAFNIMMERFSPAWRKNYFSLVSPSSLKYIYFFPRTQAHGKMKRKPTLVFVFAFKQQFSLLDTSKFSPLHPHQMSALYLILRVAVRRSADERPFSFRQIHRPEFSSRPIALSVVLNKWGNALQQLTLCVSLQFLDRPTFFLR